MSTIDKCFSNIQCHLFERTVDFAISLYHNKNDGSLFFKTSTQVVFHDKGVPKKTRKIHRKIYMPVSPFLLIYKLQVEKKFRCRCFHVNIAKFLRATIQQNMYKLLLLISQDIPSQGYLLQDTHWENAKFSSAFWHSFISN